MKKENLVSVPFMVLGIVFCVCLVAANLLETKVVQLGPISVTAGLIVFPISYIINDCIAEVWGFRKARLIIWMGFLMNFMVVAMGQIAVALPAAPFWEGEDGFNFVFGMAPRIAVASLLAFLVGYPQRLLRNSGSRGICETCLPRQRTNHQPPGCRGTAGKKGATDCRHRPTRHLPAICSRQGCLRNSCRTSGT